MTRETIKEQAELFGINGAVASKITKQIDYSVLSDNNEVVEMLRQKVELEQEIMKLDELALILLEYQLLGME